MPELSAVRSPALRRRAAVVLAAGALLVASCGAPETGDTAGDDTGGVPEAPSRAVTLNVLDVAGNLQLTKPMIENFAKGNPQVVSRVNYQTARSPDLAGKIKSQQDANAVDIDVVLTGTDGLAAGIDQDLWLELLPEFDSRLSGSMGNYLEPADKMQELAQGKGVVVSYYPSGPLLEYNPAKVADPPTTADELLAWCKANPGRFQYAIPANSGPGRTLLMGLPYILGDTDPKDPEAGWDKTWAYLKELHACGAPHPAGTGDTMKNLANGTVDMIASTTGWFLNPKVLGTVPAEMEFTTLEGFRWITDAHYVVIPKGVSTDKQAAVLQLIKHMLTPEQQAFNYGGLYFYPGPAIKDVSLDMAPQDMQDAARTFDAAAFDPLIDSVDKEPSLPAAAQVTAFAKWDREIGNT